MLETTEQKRTAIFVATPMYGGMCTGSYTAGIMQLPIHCAQNGLQMYYSYMMNESLITRARNGLVFDFLESDATHLMFIDADIGFNASDIVSMIKADKDIICGLYPKKEINWQLVEMAVKRDTPFQDLPAWTGSFVVNLKDNAKETQGARDKPLEIDNGGTGFMLIKREVFELLSDKVPTYTNDMIQITDKNPRKKIIKEFFATSIDEDTDRLLSEDYHFCKLARKNGIEVFAAPWVHLSHTGTYIFNGQIPRN